VFEDTNNVVQAAAALRKHTAARAVCAQDTAHGLTSNADAGLLREHQAMLRRYQVTAFQGPEHEGIEQQVTCSLSAPMCLFAHIFPIDKFSQLSQYFFFAVLQSSAL
jgi:hypothetical protein